MEKHVTILVPEGGKNNLSSIVGSYMILSRANSYWQQLGHPSLLKIELVGVSRTVEFYDGLFAVRPQVLISEVHKTDLIIIPSLNHHFEEAIAANGDLIDWIKQQFSNGAEVASICTGAFLLASTGILNGKSCSTHWSAAEVFRTKFPKVHLKPDATITDEQGVYTNGGAYSFLNLMLYLIEKLFDRNTAIYCSKVFQIEPDRNSQSAFAIFTGQKQHGDEVIEKAQTYIESHSQQKWSVEDLAAQLNIGRRSFDRRFIKATGNTPVEYLQRVRTELAKKSIEISNKTISEVMYDVGYSDLKAFREVFRKYTGLTPMEYKSRYQKRNVIQVS